MGTALKTPRVKIDNERVDRLKEYLLNAPQQVDNERNRFLSEVYPKLDGLHKYVKRAKFYEYLMENKKLYIDDNFFVGSVASTVAGVYAYAEWNIDWMKDREGKALSHLGEMKIAEEDHEVFEKIVEYWDNRNVYSCANEEFEKTYGYSSMPAQDTGLFYDGNSWPAGGGNANYPRVINEGLASMIKECEERMQALDISNDTTDQRYFYEACIITMKAIIKWANRYAELARKTAAEEKNADRRQELLEIADICERVPEHPARTLKEAMQSFLLIHLALEIEVTGCGYSLGYWGQYMEPFYQKDLAEGRITYEEAVYLTKLIFIKIQEIGYYHGPKFFKAWSAHVGQTLCIGGITEDGKDATAEMDYVVLDAQIYLQNIQPPLALFWHPNLKEDFLFKAIDLVKTGVGHPQFMNTDVAVMREMDRFMEDGVTLEDARRVAIFGCVGTDIAYKTAHPVEGEVSIAKAFELALNNGKCPVKNIQVGPETGDPEKWESFDDMWDAWLKQMDFAVKTARRHGRIGNMLMREITPVPLRSIMTEGCLEKGTCVWNNGAKYTADLFINVGTIDAANSLLAVKKLVFEDKKITMKELKQALAANFEGYEEIHRACLDAPKHGNDIPEVNEFVRKCYDEVHAAYYRAGKNFCGKKGKPEAYSNSLHNLFGGLMGALPSGREAGRALTDGSVSAFPGSDTNGPTALINSAAKALDTVKFNSNHFNVKFTPTAVEGPQGTRNLLNLIKTYMDQGGSHIQFNIVSSKTLKNAQLHPERYKNLVVRVAGFSAYFTRLHEGVQNEIIKRTEQKFA